jgi:hypothetical protein
MDARLGCPAESAQSRPRGPPATRFHHPLFGLVVRLLPALILSPPRLFLLQCIIVLKPFFLKSSQLLVFSTRRFVRHRRPPQRLYFR